MWGLRNSQIPYVPVNPQCYWLDQIFKIIVYVSILVGAFFVVSHIVQDTSDGGADIINEKPKSIQCYQCVVSGDKAAYPGIPTEENCSKKPTNIHQCDEGEICWKSWIGVDDTFIRGCMKRGKYALGCTNFTKPYPTKACFCETNLCV